ncbi:MAG: ATP-grasp domain-containing protein [Algibacter sp.]
MINKKISVLIPDGECPISARVINCLSEIKEIKIHIISNDENLYLKHSKYISNYSYYPKTDSQIDFIWNINKEVEKHNIDLIMPVLDDSIRIILKYKNAITSAAKLAHLPTNSNFYTAFDKGKLANHLKKHNIPFPKTKIIKKNDSYDISEIPYPVLVKPAIGSGGVGIQVFKEKSEFIEFINSGKFNNIYLAQEYIEGYDIDCSVLCEKGEIKAYTIQKGNIQGKSGFEPQIGLEFLQDDTLLNVVKILMKSLNWSGVAHIDMRYDDKTNNFKVIEINPRFWSSVEASLLSGVNFPYLYCSTSLNYDFDIPKYKNMKFMDIWLLLKNIKKNKSYLFKPNFILNNTSIKYSVNDPKAMMYKFIQFFLNKIK